MKTRPMGHPSAGAALLSPPGASAGGDGARRLELAVLVHLALFLLLATWGFGGNAPGPRRAMLAWGTLGFLLTCAGFGGRGGRRENWRRPLLWLAPLVLLDLLVAASAGNPELRGISLAGEPMLLKTGGIPGLPGSAGPRASLVALWLFNGIFLSCFNLVLLVRRRRRLRALLLFAAGNALVLAVFGTVQKLTDASGLYFGRVASPQAYFFASFVYHNHWGAFVVLMAALCLGLVWHYARHADRGFWHSPAFGGLLALLLLAASVPLSGSRSCTALLVVLLGGAFVRWAVATARDRRRRRRSPAGPLLAGALGVLAAGGLVYGLARPVIAQRVAKTFEQAAVL